MPKEWLKVPEEFDWEKLGGNAGTHFITITDDNGKIIKKLYSEDKKTLDSIDYYADDGSLLYSQWFIR